MNIVQNLKAMAMRYQGKNYLILDKAEHHCNAENHGITSTDIKLYDKASEQYGQSCISEECHL